MAEKKIILCCGRRGVQKWKQWSQKHQVTCTLLNTWVDDAVLLNLCRKYPKEISLFVDDAQFTSLASAYSTVNDVAHLLCKEIVLTCEK